MVQTLESPELTWDFQAWKRHRSWNSKVVVVEILLSAPSMFAVRKNILLGTFVVTFDVSSCYKFQIFRGSLWTLLGELTDLENAVLSPVKPLNLVFESPGK